MSWYSKGLHNGGHLRTAVNSSSSISELCDSVAEFFAIAEPATLLAPAASLRDSEMA
jgi:hypothetical protein